MNKMKMGKFLKKLRNDKKLTQEGLSDEFSKNNFDITSKAISDWENGKTIPDIEKLFILSKLYDVTIDEILEGKRYIKKDFSKEYILSNEKWYQNRDVNKNVYKLRQEEIIKVIKRFKELLILKLSNNLTRSEEDEFKFLFTNFYELCPLAKEYINSETNDNYFKFEEAMRNKLLELGNVKEDEKLFEVSKFILKKNDIYRNIELNIKEIIDDRNRIPTNPYINERFNLLEWWEKDMLLMTIQEDDLFHANPMNFGARYFKSYEDCHEKPIDKDECIRNAIRYMINNGACYNNLFLNVVKKKKIKKRIIDEIEELYLLCKKPLECSYQDQNRNAHIKYYENNRKNRFIVNHYHLFKINFDALNLSTEELYDFLWKYDPNNLPDEIYIKFAKAKNIDTNRELKYVKADLDSFSYCFSSWKEYRDEERKIENGIIRLKELEDLLKNGEKSFTFEEKQYIDDDIELISLFEFQKYSISYADLRKMRDKEKTIELLKNLNSYSLEEIRNIYFKEKVIGGDTNE